jgi:hypothetical protein
MEFDIGNLFYIVIMLVVVIVGLLGKKKKPAPGGSGESGNKSQPGFLENLERVLSMGQEQPMVQDLKPFESDLPVEEDVQVQEEVHSVSKRRSSDMMEAYNRILASGQEGGQDLIMTEGEQATESIEVTDLDPMPSGTNYFEIIRDFDVGAAVVYSAIINRLDY